MEPAAMGKASNFSEVRGVVVACRTRLSINTVNSLITAMAGTSFATPKMQNALSDWCDSGSIIRPGSRAFNMGSRVTILALAGVGYSAPVPPESMLFFGFYLLRGNNLITLRMRPRHRFLLMP